MQSIENLHRKSQVDWDSLHNYFFEQLKKTAEREFQGKFVWHPHTEKIARFMLDYFTRNFGRLEGKWDLLGRPIDLDNGLGLLGETGVGKNWLFRLFQVFVTPSYGTFRAIGSRELSDRVTERGRGYVSEWLNKSVYSTDRYKILINDLVDEQMAKPFGEEYNAVQNLVMQFDDLPDEKRFHFSSNAFLAGGEGIDDPPSIPDFMKKYGERVYWRIINNTNIIYVDGPNLREDGNQ